MLNYFTNILGAYIIKSVKIFYWKEMEIGGKGEYALESNNYRNVKA